MGFREKFVQLTQNPDRYLLYQRFSMPTHEGSVDAVAVTFEASKILQAIYTLMLSMIVLEVWTLSVLAIMAFAVRRLRITHNVGVVNVAIWNAQSSPLAVAKAMMDYWARIPCYSLIWTILALLAWVASILVSSFVSPRLIIAQAAPVNPNSVYVPAVPSIVTDQNVLQLFALGAPSNLRAIGALGTMNATTGKTLDADSTTKSAVDFRKDPVSAATPNGSPIYHYSYNISGVDFGLQHAPDLSLFVQGSCRTEYGWHVSSKLDNRKNLIDVYALPPEYQPMNVSINDGKQPMVSVHSIGPQEDTTGNTSFALVVSSVGRLSYTPSFDPWYLTEEKSDSNGQPLFRVLPQRPVLACWQNDIWSFRGQTKSRFQINEIAGLPPALIRIMAYSLTLPRIFDLTTSLGNSALKSAASPLGMYFDAEGSSTEADLQRLVFGSYIATKNTFSEATFFDRHRFPFENDLMIDPTTGKLLAGAGDFVV